MAKPILVLRVGTDVDQKKITQIQSSLQQTVVNDYYAFVVADQSPAAVVFEVYNAAQLTPITIEELKALLNLE